MAWFAANIIVYTEFKDGKQDIYPIYENIVLIEAKDGQEAHKKAMARGRLYEGDSSGSYYYGDRPGRMVCAGVRKIITCEEPDKRPGDGTEITYSQFEVRSKEKLVKLANGEPVDILYED